MANEAMHEAWNGDEGEHWASFAARYEAASVRLTDVLVTAIPVGETDRVLDVGCGNGGLALAMAGRASAGSVLALDLSSQMLDVAAKHAAAEGFTNVNFERGDVQTHSFAAGSFDLAVSSFGVMFFDDPALAFSNIANALRPGGRVVFMVWRHLHENEWLMGLRGALAMGRELPFPSLQAPTPFSLADADRTSLLLSDAGFAEVALRPVDQAMVVGRDADDAFAFVSQMGIVRGLSHDLDEAQKSEGLANVRRLLENASTAEGVLLHTAAWLITATKP